MKVVGYLLLAFLIVTIISSLFQAIVVQIPPGAALTVAVDFLVAIALASVLVWIFMRAARSPEYGAVGWVRRMTGPNTKVLFLVLLVVWAVAMGALNLVVLPPLLPAGLNGAPSAGLGGMAFAGLVVGVLLFLGFIWSVIGA